MSGTPAWNIVVGVEEIKNAILGTASSLILCNIAVPSYAFLKHTGQSQVNTDPEIDKQVLKGVALILKGVNRIGSSFNRSKYDTRSLQYY